MDLARHARDRRGESFVLYALGRNEFARDRHGSARTFLHSVVTMELSRVRHACGETQLAGELEAAARAVYSEFGLKPVPGDLIFQM